jgi:hypothetical protein
MQDYASQGLRYERDPNSEILSSSGKDDVRRVQHDMHCSKRNQAPDDLLLLSCDEFLEVCCTFRCNTHNVVKDFRLTYNTIQVK